MARTLTLRAYASADRDAAMAIVTPVYGKTPPEDILPPDSFVLEAEGRIRGFAAFYHLDDIVIAMTDWIALSEDLGPAERRAAADLLTDRFRELKDQSGLRAVLVHAPYPEFRDQLAQDDIQEGEWVRRLSVTA